MEIEKYMDSEVPSLLSHMSRIRVTNNPDIDVTRTQLNYSLTPYLHNSIEENKYNPDVREEIRKLEFDYYKKRKSELYCYNRQDIKTMAGCVVTCPEEIIGQRDKEADFFKAVSEFLCERYGGDPTPDGRRYPNVVSITVHYDERQLGEDIRGHLHFNWIPSVRINHEELLSKKLHVKAMEYYDEKISAKEVLTKSDLSSLHQDLQEYLESHSVEGRVVYKEGSAKSLNIPMAQLKNYTERTGKIIDRELLKDLTVDRLAEVFQKAREYDREHEQIRDNVFSRDHDRERTLDL